MTLLTQEWVDKKNGMPSCGPAYRGSLCKDVPKAIAQLKITDILRNKIGTTSVKNVNGWRIDRQPTRSGFVNLSVQRNRERNGERKGACKGKGARNSAKKKEPSTIASVLVPMDYRIPSGPDGDACMHELLQVVRDGLLKSFKSLTDAGKGGKVITRFEVIGTFSNPRVPVSGRP